jgi:predicted deacetylase
VSAPARAPAPPAPAGAAPALLVSVHDVSPLTLAACRRAVALAGAAGVRPDALTLLVVPRHEDRVSIHEDPATLDWLRGLSRDGATLVTHGYTHRMTGRCLDPWGAFWAHGFARGQGELFRVDDAEAAARLARARELMARAGLPQALEGFVPPAWLLSRGARAALAHAGFAWWEVLGGIVHRGERRARRVVGLGSLSAWEARATALVAACQARLPASDTRLALHPADLERPASARVLKRLLRRLSERCAPRSYASYLGAGS